MIHLRPSLTRDRLARTWRPRPSAPTHLAARFAVAAVAMAGVVGVATTQPAAAAAPVYTVMNTSESLPDGVWFRRSPHTADTDRVTGHGVYKNERVQVQCYALGDAVGAYRNTVWYLVTNVNRPTNAGVANSGYLNTHFVNDGQTANHAAPGIPQCGAAPQHTVINGVDVGLPRNGRHAWGNCTVQDFEGGPSGWLIVDFTNGVNIVRNGMLWGWLDKGGAPGFGCAKNQEYAWGKGVRQDFGKGNLYWTQGMDRARNATVCALPLRWTKTALTYSYSGGHRYNGNAWQAAADWTAAGTGITITPAKAGAVGDIEFRDVNQNVGVYASAQTQQWGVTGSTNVTKPAAPNHIVILVNQKGMDTLDDRHRTMALSHELGHALGLGHNEDCGFTETSLMAKGGPDVPRRTTLTPQWYDVLTIEQWYSRPITR